MNTYSISQLLTSHKPNNNCFYTIAIDGRGGSGKTAFAEYLKRLLPDFVFLNGDDYFEPVENQIVWGDFNDKRFTQDVIQPLKKGNSFIYRPYDWHAESHISRREVTVQKGICLERCFSFTMGLDWDIKIWIETPSTICLERGLARELMPRNRILAAWGKVWQPKEDEYIRINKPLEQADIVLDGCKPFKEQVIK